VSRHAAIIQKSLAGDELFTEHAPANRWEPVVAGSNVYAGLIARLFGGVEPLSVVGFTSALPGEGVTYTVTNVAAEIERTTRLRATVVSASGLLSSPVTQPAWILGATSQSSRSTGSDRITTLRRDFDVILVDAGSLTANISIMGVTGMVDAVVVVVEAARTTKQDLNRAVTTISAAQGRVVGFVLNKHRRVPAWLQRLLG
jgi:Mrp family chromosome partitioning ATPase